MKKSYKSPATITKQSLLLCPTPTTKQKPSNSLLSNSGKNASKKLPPLNKWNVEELEFEYDSPTVLILIASGKRIVIPWDEIISIIRSAAEQGTSYVLAKDGLADQNESV